MTDLVNEFLKTDFEGDRSKVKDIVDTFREQTKIEKVVGIILIVEQMLVY